MAIIYFSTRTTQNLYNFFLHLYSKKSIFYTEILICISPVKKGYKHFFSVKNFGQKISNLSVVHKIRRRRKNQFKSSTTLLINLNFYNFQQQKWELSFFIRYKNLHYIDCNLQRYNVTCFLFIYLFWITHPTKHAVGALSKRDMRY